MSIFLGIAFGLLALLFFVVFFSAFKKPQGQRKKLISGSIALGLICLLVSIVSFASANPSQAPTKVIGASGYSATEIPLSFNGYLVLPGHPNGEIAAGTTYDNEQALVHLSIAGDTLGIAKMVQDGQAYALGPYTQIKVIDTSYSYEGTYEVRIMSGNQFSNSAWVSGEFISSSSSSKL